MRYLYYENDPGRRSAANLLARHEAPRIAINVAKTPELVKGGRSINRPPFEG
jgi:hypothetical protein